VQAFPDSKPTCLQTILTSPRICLTFFCPAQACFGSRKVRNALRLTRKTLKQVGKPLRLTRIAPKLTRKTLRQVGKIVRQVRKVVGKVGETARKVRKIARQARKMAKQVGILPKQVRILPKQVRITLAHSRRVYISPANMLGL